VSRGPILKRGILARDAALACLINAARSPKRPDPFRFYGDPGSASPRTQPTAAPRSESQDADDLRTMPCSENGPYLNMRRSARQQARNAVDSFNNSFNNL